MASQSAGWILLVAACWAGTPARISGAADSSAVQPRAAGELIDRTMAIVAGEAVTLTDVRTALALGLVEAHDVDGATERLIERMLILREVERYAPPEPERAEIEARVQDIASRFASREDFERVLDSGGFTRGRLEAWIRDDLRIAAYIAQRFASAGVASEALIRDWIAELRRRATVVELWTRDPGAW